jgi:transposase
MSEPTSSSSLPPNSRATAPSGRRYSDTFKQDALRLITQEGYGFAAAARTLGVSEKTLREWHKKFVPAPSPCGEDASVAELQQENRRLREQLRQAEMEREILKKATAYFASQNP